jgi:hypothetical protein
MKTFFCCFLILIMAKILYAQPYHPFPTDSAQWSVRHTINNPYSQTSYQYKMKGDTILNGIEYHKIYFSIDLNYNSPNQTLRCFLREDTSKKILIKYPVTSSLDTSEFVLYNFNISLGDTVPIRLLNDSTDTTYNLVVTAVDSFETIHDFRKCYILHTYDVDSWSCALGMGIDFIEGIGSFMGLLYNEIPKNGCIDGGYEISCYWQNGLYYLGGTFCDFHTDVTEVEKTLKNVELIPNPVKNISSINLECDFMGIEIYNILGKVIMKINLEGMEKLYINRNDFLSGIYIYKLLTKDNAFIKGKFIVH